MTDQSGQTIDRISRMLGRRGSRRQAVAQLGGAGALVVGVTAIASTRQSSAQVADCSINFRATVTSSTLCGSWFDAALAFSVEADGAIDSATLTITDSDTSEWPSIQLNVPYPVVGTSAGRLFSFRAQVEDGRALTFQGVAESPVTGCDIAVAGSFSGPIGCLDGTWTTTIEAPSDWCACCCDYSVVDEYVPPVAPTPIICEKGYVFNKKTGMCELPVVETPTATVTETPTETPTVEPTETPTVEPTATTPSCPPNSAWDGEACVCAEGYELQDGACVVLCGANEFYLATPPPCEYICTSEAYAECYEVDMTDRYCFCLPGYARINGVCIAVSACPAV